ncbi:MAG: STAS domain-containing protein [Oscillibacter sp.]|nr:STAS domain-containing protein [Oscillibacter sp.]
MTINTQKDGAALVLALEGRLDTTTSPELEAVLAKELPDAQSLTMDLAGLSYLSSAGLRLLLSAQKTMSARDGMTVKNVNETIMEVFEITGFSDILTIE